MRFSFKIFFLTVLIFGVHVSHAAMVKNAGFTNDELLMSNTVPVAGELVRISMPIYNETKGTLFVVARLYQDDIKISEKSITIKTNEFNGFSYEWKAVPGVHTFTLKLEDTFLQLPKQSKEIIVLENRTADGDIRTQGSNKEEDTLLKKYNINNENQSVSESNSIDSYRQDFLNDAQDKIDSIKLDINSSVKQNEEYEKRLEELRTTLPRADGSLLTPLQYVYAWALGALAYILSNIYLFYGIIVLVIILVLRFIIRKFHNRHHRLTR